VIVAHVFSSVLHVRGFYPRPLRGVANLKQTASWFRLFAASLALLPFGVALEGSKEDKTRPSRTDVSESLADAGQLVDYAHWNALLPALSKQYREAEPFPHIQLENVFDPEVAMACVEEFPTAGSGPWTVYKHYNEDKVGLTKRQLFPPTLGRVTDELNSEQFVRWISALTGFHDLVPDPQLVAGGLQQSGAGGFLNVHADFTMHHYRRNLRRRVNVILYLNPGWKPEWGGALELWDRTMSRCVERVPPTFNRLLIFNSTETSYHGFPARLTCDEGVTRKTLALYYYSVEQQTNNECAFAHFQPLPDESKLGRVLIQLDTMAVHAYSRVKRAFGVNDDLISKVLALVPRRRRPPG